MEIKHYYRIMPGAKSVFASECFGEGFIGGDWGFDTDLTGKLPENWREFNKTFIPVFLAKNPGKSRVAAGLACGMLHAICKGMKIGDVVISPDGTGNYRIGEVTSEYFWQPGKILPHRRAVHWHQHMIQREDMTQELKNSSGSIGTVSNLTKYSEEFKQLVTVHGFRLAVPWRREFCIVL